MPQIHASVERTDTHKVRTANVSGDVKRTSFRFDVSTWAALDMVAANAGISWVEWVSRAITANPKASSKASAIRSALTDALLSEQFQSMANELGAGERELSQVHPIVGSGYYCLDDVTLAAELDMADITVRNDCFESFTLLIGYRGKTFGGNAFVCIENRLKNGLHFFIAKD